MNGPQSLPEFEWIARLQGWVSIAETQLARFEEADLAYGEAVSGLLARVPGAAHVPMTQRLGWEMAGARYFSLLALGQVVKCVAALPDEAHVPQPPGGSVLRWLRDMEEHWEQQGDQGRSLSRMKKDFPAAAPTRWRTDGGKRLWLHEDLEVDEVRGWLGDVEQAVHRRAVQIGQPLGDPDKRLTWIPGMPLPES